LEALPPNPTISSPDQAATLPSPPLPSTDQPGSSEPNGATTEPLVDAVSAEIDQEPYCFCKRFLRGYSTLVQWFPGCLGPLRTSGMGSRPSPEQQTGAAANGEDDGGGYGAPSAPRRAPPSPWDSPPFPNSEYQGYPLIGVPASSSVYPLLQA